MAVFNLPENTIVEVVKFEKQTNKAVDVKEMELSVFKRLKSKTHYYKAYQIGFSKFLF